MIQPGASSTRLADVLNDTVVGTQSLRVQLIPIVHHILEQMNFGPTVERFCGDNGDVPAWKILEAFIHSRVASHKPLPLSGLEGWVEETILPQVLNAPASGFNEYRVGRVLEIVGAAPRGLWFELLGKLHSAYSFDLSWDIYDISSVYFEGDYSKSELAEYGYSRDGKPGAKQVNIGINVSGADSIPVLYHLLPGNTEDGSTVADNLLEMKLLYSKLGLAGVPELLGDRAMLSVPLVHRYLQANVDFIGSMKSCKPIDDVLASIPDELLLQNPVDYVAHRHRNLPDDQRGEERYFAVRTLVTIPPHKDVAGSSSVNLPCLVVLASGKRRLDRQHRETLLSRVEQRLEEISGFLNKTKYKSRTYTQSQIEKALSKYPTTKGLISAELEDKDGLLTLTWSRNAQAIHHVGRDDGKYVIVFRNAQRTTEEVFHRFKCRDRVEKRMDDIKGSGPVIVRPIYLHKDERIRGLVLGCMIGLLVLSIAELAIKRGLQKKLTAEGLQATFGNFNAILHTLSDQGQMLVMPACTKWQRQILEAVSVRIQRVTPARVPLGVQHPLPPPPWQDVPHGDVPDG